MCPTYFVSTCKCGSFISFQIDDINRAIFIYLLKHALNSLTLEFLQESIPAFKVCSTKEKYQNSHKQALHAQNDQKEA